jgi:hypothetical protein
MKNFLTISILLFLTFNAFSQGNKNVITAQIIHITQAEYNSMKADVKSLKDGDTEGHEYYIDKTGKIYFLLKKESDLFYYAGRQFTDTDIANNIERRTYCILHADNSSINKRTETVKIDLNTKTILR